MSPICGGRRRLVVETTVVDSIKEALQLAFMSAQVGAYTNYSHCDFVIELMQPYKHMVLRVGYNTLENLEKRPSLPSADMLVYLRTHGVIEKLSANGTARM